MFVIKRFIVMTVLSLFTSVIYAGSEIETLINMLHKNGIVSDEQFSRLQAELKQNQMQVVQEKQAVKKQLAEATKESDVEIKVKGGVAIKTRDGQFSTKLGGRLQVDGASYGGDPHMGNGTEIRRARLYLQGMMYHDWGYKLQYDFASTGSNGKGIKDAYLTYNGLDNWQLKAGNFKLPFSLEQQISSKYTMFTERSLLSAFTAGRRIGAIASIKKQHWSLAGGLFGESLTTKGNTDDEGWSVVARATFAPINQKSRILHFGLGVNHRDTGDLTNTVSFKQRAETHVTGVNIVNTGRLTNVEDLFTMGAEAATVMGPFSLQAEYITTSASRNRGDKDVDFDGWYVQTSYFLTGESRRYKKGVFSGATPKNSFGELGIGAFELGLRYSTLDLIDRDIDGGEVDSVTLGLNWYATPTVRVSANYVNLLDVKGGPNDKQEPHVFQLRGQWAF